MRESSNRSGPGNLARALEAGRAGAWDWDLTTQAVSWSDQTYRLLGLEPGSVDPGYEVWRRRLHPLDREAAAQAVLGARESGEDLDIEFRVVWPDETVRWLNAVGRTDVDGEGRPVRIYGLQIDITDRKLAELGRQAALETLRSYEQIVSATPDMTALIDRDYVYRIVNDAYLRAQQRPREEVVGRTVAEVLGTELFRDFLRGPLDRSLAGEVVRERLWWDVPQLGRRFFSVTCYPFRSAEGGFSAVVVNARDITERMRLEEQLLQSQKMEAVGQLAAGIAHDFNNLLTVISGNCDLLRNQLPADASGILLMMDDIQNAAQRAGELTRQLLAFGRKQVFRLEVFDLQEAVEGLDRILRKLMGETVEVEVRRSEIPLMVETDRSQLDQVLLNLALNARDAMPRGGRFVVEVGHSEVDPERAEGLELTPGSYVTVAMTDSGIGMDRKVRARIFEPFFTTKKRGRGTGLGLSTSFGIVKQSGGHIEVASQPGLGSRFTLYLPVSHRGPTPRSIPVSSGAVGGSETVLVVEDQSAVRRLAKQILQQQGYRALVAKDAEEAMEIARLHPGRIHLLLADVVLPGESGPELARRLMAERPDMRILFMSGHGLDVLREHGDPEARRLVTKPLEPDVLGRAIREALQ